MSKFLKFIVHLIVICTIICVLGLALPPFFGIETVIIDTSEKATNLPIGSVTYAIPVQVEDVTVGTPILVQEDSKTYRYNLVNVNPESSTGTVKDPSISSDEGITVSVHNWVQKVVATIPFVGYLLVATQSIEGMIILGLAVLFLIILYVIAELWKKDPEDEDEYEDLQGDVKRVKTSRELKQEEKEREKRMDREDRELLESDRKRRKKAKKEEKKNRKKIHTGGFVDEIYEDDLDEDTEDQEEPKTQKNEQAATTEAHEILKKEIAAATVDDDFEEEADGSGRIYPNAEQEDEDQADSDYLDEPDEEVTEEEEEPVPIRKLAIPRYSASQLASKARKAGDAPDIVRDSITNVTLLDYSDIIGSDTEDEEE